MSPIRCQDIRTLLLAEIRNSRGFKSSNGDSYIKITMFSPGEENSPLRNRTYRFEMQNITRHIGGIKGIGTGFLLLVTICSPVLILTGLMSQELARPPDDVVRVSAQDLINQTACLYAKRFHLGQQVYLTVCNLNGEIILDLRRFFNQSASIRGIPLSVPQWESLKHIIWRVDTTVRLAKTHAKVYGNKTDHHPL